MLRKRSTLVSQRGVAYHSRLRAYRIVLFSTTNYRYKCYFNWCVFFFFQFALPSFCRPTLCMAYNIFFPLLWFAFSIAVNSNWRFWPALIASAWLLPDISSVIDVRSPPALPAVFFALTYYCCHTRTLYTHICLYWYAVSATWKAMHAIPAPLLKSLTELFWIVGQRWQRVLILDIFPFRFHCALLIIYSIWYISV